MQIFACACTHQFSCLLDHEKRSRRWTPQISSLATRTSRSLPLHASVPPLHVSHSVQVSPSSSRIKFPTNVFVVLFSTPQLATSCEASMSFDSTSLTLCSSIASLAVPQSLTVLSDPALTRRCHTVQPNIPCAFFHPMLCELFAPSASRWHPPLIFVVLLILITPILSFTSHPQSYSPRFSSSLLAVSRALTRSSYLPRILPLLISILSTWCALVLINSSPSFQYPPAFMRSFRLVHPREQTSSSVDDFAVLFDDSSPWGGTSHLANLSRQYFVLHPLISERFLGLWQGLW